MALTENYMGTDVPASDVPLLDRYRLEARIRVLEGRDKSHGLNEAGKELLSYCKMHLEDIMSIYFK